MTELAPLARVPQLIVQGIECWIEAGEIVAEYLSKNPNSMGLLCETTGLSEDIIRRFEQIGRKEIYPKLLVNTSLGYRKLSACPYREQELYAESPVDLVVMGDKGPDILRVSVDHLTPEQAKQVFARNHVRSTAEQRAWLETERKRANEAAAAEKQEIQTAAYAVHGKRVVFRKGCEMTLQELAVLIARLSG